VIVCDVLVDRGFDSDKFRLMPEGNTDKPVIPGRKNRKKAAVMTEGSTSNARILKRVFGKIKENRHLVVL
jgi:hypothetical protein